jgi:hypothetical protein
MFETLLEDLRNTCSWCGSCECIACKKMREQAAAAIESLSKVLYAAHECCFYAMSENKTEIGVGVRIAKLSSAVQAVYDAQEQ